MFTHYDTGDKVLIVATIKHAAKFGDTICYTLEEIADYEPDTEIYIQEKDIVERYNQDRASEDRITTLIDLSKRVADYLQKHFHPHTTVVIETDSIRVEETLAAKAIEYAVD